MKTINLKLSKRLTPILDNMWIEYFIDPVTKKVHSYNEILEKCDGIMDWFIPTLTLEEVIIELLPSWIHLLKHIDKNWKPFYTSSSNRTEFVEDTPLEAIEKMLEYLLDNNLLNNQ